MKEVKCYQIACLMAVILLPGCGIYGKKSKFEKKSEHSSKQYQEQRLLFHQKHMDSLSTYWYFWTDSLLSFRPDSGLKAHGGLLYVEQLRNTLAEKKLDAGQMKTQAKDTLDSVVVQDRKTFSFDSLLIVIAVFFAVIYFIWRFRLTMR